MSNANYLRQDHSKHFLSINPLFKDDQFPNKVMELQISLDFAKLFANTLEAVEFVEHAKIMRDWIKSISEREELKETSSVTYTNTEEGPKVFLIPRPGSYYKIISRYGFAIGKCTAEAREDVMAEEPGCTFEEISKEEFVAEDE